MHQHEDQAAVAQAEPEQGQRQQRDGGQRVEHRGQRFQQIVAEAGTDGDAGEQRGEHDAAAVADKQDFQREAGAGQQGPGLDAVE